MAIERKGKFQKGGAVLTHLTCEPRSRAEDEFDWAEWKRARPKILRVKPIQEKKGQVPNVDEPIKS